MQNSPDFDYILKENFVQEIEKIDVPNFDMVWKEIEERNKKAKQKRRIKMLTQIAAMFLIFSSGIALTMPDFVSALSSKIETVILTKKDGGTEIRVKIEQENKKQQPGLPLPPDVEEIEPEELTLELSEAKEVVPFHFYIPQYVPKGLNAEKVEITKFSNLYHINQRYVNGERYIMLDQENILGERASSRNFSKDAKIKEIEILGNPATLVDFTEVKRLFILFWTRVDMECEIHTNTSEEELIKFAESLK